MYDMYPDDWGYTRHRDHDEASDETASARSAVQSAMDLRDHGGPRPDDN